MKKIEQKYAALTEAHNSLIQNNEAMPLQIYSS